MNKHNTTVITWTLRDEDGGDDGSVIFDIEPNLLIMTLRKLAADGRILIFHGSSLDAVNPSDICRNGDCIQIGFHAHKSVTSRKDPAD